MTAIAAPRRRNRPYLSGHLIGAVASGVALQAVLAVSGILAARMLGPTNRGDLALLVVLSSVMCQLGALGISVAAAYFVSQNRGNATRIVAIVARPAALQTVAVASAYALTLAVVFRGASRSIAAAALLSILLVPASYGLEYGLAFLQGLNELRIFNVLRVLPSALYSAGLLLLFAVGVHSLTAIVASAVIAGLAAAAVVAVFAFRSLSRTPRLSGKPSPRFAEIFSFGWRSALGLLSSVDSFRLDQLMVAVLLSTRALGFYVVAAAFTNLPRFVAQSVGAVAFPRVASYESDKSAGRGYIFFGIAVSFSISTVLALSMAPMVHYLFGQRFSSAISPGRILALGAVFFAARRVISDVARGRGFPATGSYGEAATLCSFLAGAPVFGSLWGLNGVALAYGLAGLVGLAVVVGIARRRGL